MSSSVSAQKDLIPCKALSNSLWQTPGDRIALLRILARRPQCGPSPRRFVLKVANRCKNWSRSEINESHNNLKKKNFLLVSSRYINTPRFSLYEDSTSKINSIDSYFMNTKRHTIQQVCQGQNSLYWGWSFHL